MFRFMEFIFVILTALVGIPIVRYVYQGMMPTIQSVSTVPEVAMWKLIPLGLLICVFTAALVHLIRGNQEDTRRR